MVAIQSYQTEPRDFGFWELHLLTSREKKDNFELEYL